MQSQLQNTKYNLDYQQTFSNILEKVTPLYEQFVPDSIRNQRARLFAGTADIGFNATKQLFYYGLKLSVSIIKDFQLVSSFQQHPFTVFIWLQNG